MEPGPDAMSKVQRKILFFVRTLVIHDVMKMGEKKHAAKSHLHNPHDFTTFH